MSKMTKNDKLKNKANNRLGPGTVKETEEKNKDKPFLEREAANNLAKRKRSLATKMRVEAKRKLDAQKRKGALTMEDKSNG